MAKFRVVLSTGYHGADHEDEVELPDDMDKETAEGELSQCVEDLISNHIEGHWEPLDEAARKMVE